MKIALSGSHGFIGTHLTERLHELGHVVIPISRHLRMNSRAIALFLEQTEPEYIFDLAAYGNHFYQLDEMETYRANVKGVFYMLEGSKDYPFKGYLNFSTSSHNLEAGTFYGSTKSSGEYMVRAFQRKYDKPIVNIRPQSVFGEHEWDFRFIPTIASQIRQGLPITVSNVSHDWIYVEDFIDGVIDVVKHMSELQGKSIAIGTGTRIPNRAIADILMDIADRKVEVKEGEKRSYEIASHEQMTEGEKRNDQIEYFQFAKTSLKISLKRVYKTPDLRLKRI